jgi:hypothetical protein
VTALSECVPADPESEYCRYASRIWPLIQAFVCSIVTFEVVRCGTDKRCMSPTNGLKRAAIIVPVVGVVLIVSMVARPLPGEQTPWEFFRDAVPHIDSIGKGLSLAFFTTVLTFMNFMAVAAKLRLSLLLPIALIALVSLAVFSPAVRQSRLVRMGFGLVALGVVPLIIAGTFTNNPLGFGFLFAFLTPVGGLLIVSGTIFALAEQSPDRQKF